MLNELLKDEEFGRIFFAELLNQNGAETGVDTEKMFKEWARENPNEDYVVLGEVLDKENEDDIMEDIPINIKQLEEKAKLETKLDEPQYYAGNGLSPLEAFKKGLLSREETIGFIKGNVIKYTVRAGKKDNASKDIVKAIDYLTHLKKLYESDERSNQAQELMKQAFEDLNKIEEKQ